jgi:hypothetical protein
MSSMPDTLDYDVVRAIGRCRIILERKKGSLTDALQVPAFRLSMAFILREIALSDLEQHGLYHLVPQDSLIEAIEALDGSEEQS